MIALQIIQRSKALAEGLPRYFTGKPCPQGHVAERRVGSYGCVVCEKARGLAAYRANPEKGRAQNRRWRELNPEKARESNRSSNAKWFEKNRESYNARMRARYAADSSTKRKSHKKYQDKNPEANRARAKAWREANPERYAELNKKWRAENKSVVLGLIHARRARQHNSGGRYTKADIDRIYTAQRGKCAGCRANVGKKFHVDHIIPIAKGGDNSARNIQIMCAPCNLRKSASDPIDFNRREGRLL